MSATSASGGDNKVTALKEEQASLVALKTVLSPTPVPPTGSSTVHALASLKAAKIEGDQTTQRPVHLSLSIDLSGSMNGPKLETAKAAMNFVVEQMRSGLDQIGIITFDSNVEVALPMTKMDEVGKARARQAIAGLKARGATFLSGGLFAGICQCTGQPLDLGPNQSDSQHLWGGNSRRSQKKATPNFAFNTTMISSSMPAVGALHHHHHPGMPFAPPPPPPNSLPSSSSPIADIKTVQANISFKLDDSGNNPAEKYKYSLSIKAPDEISKFTVHDSENRFADIVGAGESEFDLKPQKDVISSLEITFDLPNKKNHKITFFMGNIPSGKRTVSIPLDPVSKGEVSPGTTPPLRSPRSSSDVIRQVFLLTDGRANGGLSETSDFVRETRARLASAPCDVSVSCFGFGPDHESNLLRSISDEASGSFFYIEGPSKISEVFADALGSCFSIVAQAVQVSARIKSGTGLKFTEAKTKFKHQILEDGKMIVVTLKDIYAEETREFLLELQVDGPTAKTASLTSAPEIEYSLKFTPAIGGSSSTASPAPVEVSKKLEVPVSGDSAPVVNNEVDAAQNRWKSIVAIEQVREAAEAGDYKRASETASKWSAMFSASPSAQTATTQNLVHQLGALQNASAQGAQGWSQGGSQQAVSYSQQHCQQRANAIESDCLYSSNAVRMSMRKQATQKPN